ncbi:MAG: AMP-binding protein, partial [Acidobacteria bacterium]|nr:AMP-binding protein [Acidobacteriota bacterium]
MSDIRRRWREVVKKYRLHPRTPADDRYWCPELETCSRQKLKDVQEEKLSVLVRYLYDCSPFYRAKFDRAKLRPSDIRSLDDILKIPVTNKQEMADDVQANPPWGTYTPIDDATWAKRGWMVFATSGSTGTPRPFRYTLHDRDQWAWNDARVLWAQGLREGDSAFLASGYGPHVFFWGVHYGLNLMGIPVISGGGMDTKRRAYMIDTFRPTVLGATPSYALYLGHTMQQMGYDPRQSSIRIILTGGEPGACIPATKARIEDLWKARLVEFYGCTEASPTPGGYTCREESEQIERPMNLHLMEDLQIWEVLDPTTFEPLPLGQRGLTTVTNLFSEGSPQLRFLVGDYAVMRDTPCACGRTQIHAEGGFLGRE